MLIHVCIALTKYPSQVNDMGNIDPQACNGVNTRPNDRIITVINKQTSLIMMMMICAPKR